MNTDFRGSALKETLAKYGKLCILDTDQDSPFTGFAFTKVFARKRHPYFNGRARPLAGQCPH